MFDFLILAISVGVLGIILAVALVVSIVILTGWITRLMLRRDSEPASESTSE